MDRGEVIVAGGAELRGIEQLGRALRRISRPPQQLRRRYIERVDRIEPYGKDSKVAILRDNSRLPISRSGYERLRVVLEGKG